MRQRIIMAVVAGLSAIDSSPGRGANLLTNGSFEQGPPIPYMSWGGRTGYLFVTLPDGNTEIPGWIVKTPSGSGDVDYKRDYWQASDGFFSVDLCGFNGGGIAQTFATVAGQMYAVTFDIAANPTVQGALNPKAIEVSAAGESHLFSHDNTGRTFENMGWETHTWFFRA